MSRCSVIVPISEQENKGGRGQRRGLDCILAKINGGRGKGREEGEGRYRADNASTRAALIVGDVEDDHLDDDEGPVDDVHHEEDAEALLGLLARAWSKRQG